MPVRTAESYNAILTVDLAAITENYRRLQAQSQKAVCAAVVKADGYGLGAGPISRALYEAGCRTFFVATLAEAVSLRKEMEKADMAANIGVLNGIFDRAEPLFAEHRLTPVLNNLEQCKLWSRESARQYRKLPALLHIDTGMARLGLNGADVRYFAENRSNYPGVTVQFIMSHLACADEPDHEMNREQLNRFHEFKAPLERVACSLANSSGIYLGSLYHFQLMRPGCALYGVNPTPQSANPMLPVVKLSAPILQIRTLERDSTVGYGATTSRPAGTKLATVGLGYADGFMRALAGKAQGSINGHRVSMVGRVSMDLTVFDVSTVPEAELAAATHIELLNHEILVDHLAQSAGTIGYEILTSLGSRFSRVYIGAP